MAAERLVRRALLAVRRSRFMPLSSVDRVSDLTEPVTATVMVYFPTAPNTLYQLRAWYPALKVLHATHPVVVVCRDSRTARAVRTESGLQAVSVSTLAELGELLDSSSITLALYPNLDVLDFEALAATGIVHVYIGHGDSAKAVFSSHQVTAFDRYFVATEESVDRVGDQLLFFDAPTRCVVIGEPQSEAHTWDVPPSGDRAVVVYAPTWEGASPQDAHSSLVTHGPAVIAALLAAQRFQIVYRPHPLTGTHDPHVAEVDAAVRSRLAGTSHRVDTGPDLVQAFRGASALICDVSAVASQWRPSGRPLVVLRPTEDVDAAAVIDDLQRQWDEPTVVERDTRPATTRFVEACTEVMAERDRLRAGPAGSPDRPDASA